jgi:hypothetical protein
MTASSAFTQRSAEVGRIAVDIIRVDRLLRNYGPEADGARQSLAQYAAIEVEDLLLTISCRSRLTGASWSPAFKQLSAVPRATPN